MRTTLIALFAALILTSMSLAQTSTTDQGGAAASSGMAPGQANSDAQAASAAGQSGGQIAPGTVIPAELTKSLDAKKVKEGAQIEARISQDLLSHGEVVIARGTKIIGHVTQAQPRAKGENSSMIGIAFDQIVTKDGKVVPMNAGIQAIGKPVERAVSVGGESEPMSEGGIGGPGGVTGAGRVGSMPAHPGAGQGSGPDIGVPGGSEGVGALSPGASGVVGLKDLSLSQNAQGSVVSSDSQNVHLDSGTQLMLRVK